MQATKGKTQGRGRGRGVQLTVAIPFFVRPSCALLISKINLQAKDVTKQVKVQEKRATRL